MGRRKTIEEFRTLAEENGIMVLGEVYKNNYTPILCQCKCCKHKWSPAPTKVQQGRGCPQCAGNIKGNLENFRKLAAKRGIIVLGEEYINNSTPVLCQCKLCKHEWSPAPTKVQQGHGCPQCAGNIKGNLEDFTKKALSCGIVVLGKEYINSVTPILCQCKLCKHEWKPVPSSVQRGYGCPMCNKPGKTQRLLCEIIKKIFPQNHVYYNYREFDWLRSIKQGSGQEIDVFVEDVKLAIEYDGKQHFEPVKHWGGQETFDNIKRRDVMKNKKIADNPNDVRYFIRFNYKERITEEYVLQKLKMSGMMFSEQKGDVQ